VLKARPQFSSRELSGPADVGLLVHVNGRFAIVGVSPQDPQKRFQLAAFDATVKTFTHEMYNGATALVFGGELIFEPDLSNPTTEEPPQLASGSKVFFDGKEFYVVLQLVQGKDWRLLTLGSGTIVQWNGNRMHMFPRYRLGVADDDGEIRWLFQT
jgi:hypothetical protein